MPELIVYRGQWRYADEVEKIKAADQAKTNRLRKMFGLDDVKVSKVEGCSPLWMWDI